jgi:uncharacterized cupredoxin-like copper-binding protein
MRAIGRNAVAVSLLAASAALGSCGGSGSGGGGGASGEGGSGLGAAGGSSADLEVLAGDMAFDRDAYTLDHGQQLIEYVQDDGQTEHTLRVEDADGDTIDGLDLEVGGESTDEGSVDLAPGRYTLYCDVSGHREAGMEAELEVR